MPEPTPAATTTPQANLRGIFAMLAGMATFVVGDAMMKLISTRLPAGEAIFLRGLIAMPIVWFIAFRQNTVHKLAEIPKKLLMMRNMGDAGGSLMFQSGLSRIPFADAGAILQLNPLLVTAGAALFLGEKVGWRRWTATVVGLLGVLLIIRPGSSAFSWASLLVVGAVLFATMRDLVTRKLPVGIPTVLVTATATTAISLCALLLAPFETWIWPTAGDFAFLVIPALCMLLGQTFVVISIRSGDVSTVVPFRYSAILWSLLLSYLVWSYIPDATTFTGIAIVAAAGLYTLLREQKLRRLARRAAQ
ncbi:MAG TPA: DMT family transporter [Hyphomicrobiaceae bacterium]|nr:DMT family transporter [Hyphomicrobiaceae bacterium]